MLFDLDRARQHFDEDVRFSEDCKTPQELEKRMKETVGDIKREVDGEIRDAVSRAKRHGVPSGFNNAYDYLVHEGIEAIEAIYNEVADKGRINDSRQDQKMLDALIRQYMMYIQTKVNSVYKELQ